MNTLFKNLAIAIVFTLLGAPISGMGLDAPDTGMSLADFAESVGMTPEEYRKSLGRPAQAHSDGLRKQTQAELDAIQFAKEKETKRKSEQSNATQANTPDTDTPESILANAFNQLSGNKFYKEKIQDLPEELRHEIAHMFVSMHARQCIKDATRFVSDHIDQLFPAIMTKSYSDRDRDQENIDTHLNDLYSNYQNSDHNIVRAQPIILGGYILGGQPLPTNAGYRSIYTVTELLDRPLCPSEVAWAIYSDGNDRIILSSSDRKSLLALSQEQRKFIVSMYGEQDRITGIIERPFTPKETAIFKSLPITMQHNLAAYYKFDISASPLTLQAAAFGKKFGNFVRRHPNILPTILFLETVIIYDQFFWNRMLENKIRGIR